MKRILLALHIILLAGCTKDYLDSKPSDQLSDSNFWQSDVDALSGVTAIYYQMQHNYQIYGYLPLSDVMTPNGWIWSDYLNGYGGIAKGSLLATNFTPVNDKWQQLYNGIYKANLALQKIPGVKMNDALKQRLIGEAMFLRALFYFNLADYYGGVPIITKTLKLGDDLPGRNTREEVLSFITSQCDSAAQRLPVTYAKSDIGRATQGAALTLKTKAFLLGKHFREAADAAKQVMGFKQYSLYDDYASMFTDVSAENNAEVIFDVQYAGPGLGLGSPMDGFMAPQSSFSKGWDQAYPTQDLVDAYEMTNGKSITDPGSGYNPAKPYDNRDPRLDFTIVRPGSVWKGIPYDQVKIGGAKATFIGYLPRKYVLTVDGFNWGDSPLNYIVFRYADLLLMYAEAENEASGAIAPVYDAINQVRARKGVNMPPIPAGKTKIEMRDIIYHERRVELAFEGIYYSDIRRWGLAKQLVNGAVIRTMGGQQVEARSFVDALYLWPVPQGEIDLNPKLTQNPGY
jgi:hypothetical protein